MRRASGATTRTTGKATAQDAIQAPIQSEAKPSTRPAARNVEMPETDQRHQARQDQSEERVFEALRDHGAGPFVVWWGCGGCIFT